MCLNLVTMVTMVRILTRSYDVSIHIKLVHLVVY